jgi:hypothetical protein
MPAVSSDKEWEAAYERVVEANPPSEAYDPFKDDDAKHQKDLRRLLQKQRK